MLMLANETKRGLCRMARAGYPDLTRRETEVLQLYLQGLPTKDIAHRLKMHHSNITSKYLPIIRDKFQVSHPVDLVLACVWFGFIEPKIPKLMMQPAYQKAA